MKHIPVLVILFPLCGALLCPLLDKLARNVGKRAAILALLLSAICAATQLAQVARSGAAMHYRLGGWQPPYGIEFVIDGMNAPIILLVAGISFLTALYSSPFEDSAARPQLRVSVYYSTLSFWQSAFWGWLRQVTPLTSMCLWKLQRLRVMD